MAQDLPPVPRQSPMLDDQGMLSRVWSDWLGMLTGDSSKASPGYQKLPGGITVQWGVTGSVSSGVTSAVSFGSTFSGGCLQVFAGVRDNSAVATSATGHWGTGNYSTSGFSLYNRTNQSYTFNWVAIGY